MVHPDPDGMGFRNGGEEEVAVTFMMLHGEGDFLMFLSSSSLKWLSHSIPFFGCLARICFFFFF